jgi:hypothetical protein
MVSKERKKERKKEERKKERKVEGTYKVINVDKVNSDRGSVKVREGSGVMDELGQLALTHLLGLEPKHKQHRVNHVGLATSIRSNH